jgi:hypothetical protein
LRPPPGLCAKTAIEDKRRGKKKCLAAKRVDFVLLNDGIINDGIIALRLLDEAGRDS